jgi:hypothetical protein
MKENANEPTRTDSETNTATTKQFNRRLALLKTEVSIDFPELIPQLDAGQHVVLITDRKFAAGLEPDLLRRLGGMVMLCSYYGAAVVFVNDNRVLEISGSSTAEV